MTMPLTATSLNEEPVDFAHQIVPILKQHCAECHTGGHSEGGFSFSTARQFRESGYVKPGHPQDSRLMQLVHSTDVDDQMPPSDRQRLTPEEVRIIEQWIREGAAWEPGFRFAKATYEPPVLPRTVVVPNIPAAGTNPIDRILQAYCEGHSITPSRQVSAEVFLRRAYMDIIGIPPSIEEQRAFLSMDFNEVSRQRLVTQLLDRSQDYAEHWISFWNDLLRNDYVGTGYIDGGRRQITTWLYGALVDNRPYDEFVRELINPTNASDGFINGIKWRGSVNASQVTEIQFAQNVSQVFLGINMKCASCHDSFIDRWTLDDAYGLAAIYSKRELTVHRCDKPIGRTATPQWIFPEIGHVDPTAEQPERLKQLAHVMTSPKNGRFSRTIANRIWHRMMGRGIVHPVDAMHTEPWSADLLDYLANYLVANRYDLKALIRLIATSRAYRSTAAGSSAPASTEAYVFRGPVRRHLTAEQIMDAVWHLTGTAPQRIDAPIPAALRDGGDTPPMDRSGDWIWSYEDTRKSPAGEVVWFRKQLELAKRPRKATLVITCDNEYTLYVNQKKIAADNNWGDIETVNVSSRLRRGVNEILVRGKNAGNAPNPSSLYAELIIEDTLPEPIHHATNASWLASMDEVNPKQPDAATWKPAVVTPFTPGTPADDAIRRAIGRALKLSSRPTRAALLKSNLLMRSLGRPNREQVVTVRPESLSTLQAIDLANGDILDRMLHDGAEQILTEEVNSGDLINTLFQKSLIRRPNDEERAVASQVLGEAPTVNDLQDLLWLLVMHPEFQFIH